MVLYVPKYLINPGPKPRSNTRIGTYLTLAMLTGKHYHPANLFTVLAKYRRSDVIRWITAVSGWISSEHGMNIRQQMKMAEVLLSDELQKSASDRINKEGNIFCIFHRRQIHFMLQFAVLGCNEDAPECVNPEFAKVIGECLLMASDILGRIEHGEMPAIGERPEELNRWIARAMAPLITVRDKEEILVRGESFWFEIPLGKYVQEMLKENGLDPPADAFEAKYGIPLRDFFLVVVCLYHRFLLHVANSTSPLKFDYFDFLKPFFSRKVVDRSIALISAEPDDLANKLIAEPRQNWASDITALRERPLIRLSPDQVVCPDFGLLYRCLVDRIYFLLDRAYDQQAFPKIFGYIFEDYVHNLLRQFAHDATEFAHTLYVSPHYEGTNDQAADAILFWDDTAVVMEYKARLLTTRERYAGIEQALMLGIDDIIGKEGTRSKKGVTQLSTNLKRLLSGQKVVAGSRQTLDLSSCRVVYPTLVVNEESLAVEAIRQYAEASFRESLTKREIDSTRIGPLLILSLEDIETLEAMATKLEIKRLIGEYADHIQRNPKERLGNFRVFLVNRNYGDLVKMPYCWVGKRHSQILNKGMSELEERQKKDAPSEMNDLN